MTTIIKEKTYETKSKAAHRGKSRKEAKQSRDKVISKLTEGTLIERNPVHSKKADKQVAKNVLTLAHKQNAVVRDRNRDMAKIILSLCAPREYPPVRMGAQFAPHQTAVAHPFARYKAEWSDTSSSGDDRDSVSFLFRDAFRFNVYNYKVTSPWVYRMTAPGSINVATNAIPYEFGRWGWASGPKVHGNFLYPGRIGNSGRSYIWMDPGNTLDFTNNGAVQFTFRVFSYLPSGELSTGGSVTANPAATVTILGNPSSGQYVGVDISSSSPSGAAFIGMFELKTGTALTGWGQRSVPWIDTNVTSVDALKMYAASQMFTNSASPLNRQGKIASAQIPAGRDWRDFVNYDGVSRIIDSWGNDAVNGYYGFLKPMQPRDIDFMANHEIEADFLQYAWFDITTPSDFLVTAVQVTTAAGRDAVWTLACACEYRTNDQWRDTKFATIDAQTVQLAMTAAGRVVQHHENPSHISDILGAIGSGIDSVWKGVKEFFPKVVSGLTTAAHVATIAAPLFL